MSGGTSTITGSPNAQGGIVGVPSNFTPAVNALLQTYLDGLAGSITGGTAGFENYDLATGNSYSNAVSGGLEQFSNVDSTGAAGGTVSGSAIVDPAATDVVVSAPGDVTLTGNGQTSVAVFGAGSNVAYSDVNGGSAGAADSIYAGGGNDSIALYSTTNANSAYQVVSAGNDTVNLQNQGTDSVSATGSANITVYISQADATVTAADSSNVSVQFSRGAGGNLDFINNSTNAATIYSGNYVGGAAPNSVTAFGGAGGGYFVGGTAGNNSLVGGTGAVTLQGAGNNDYLEANSSIGTNILFAGSGTETLIASSTTGANTFQLGLQYTGDNGAIVANAMVSTDGSGLQAFILGSSSSSTLTGSNAAGATNLYDFIRDSATESNGGANYTITDFNAANSTIFITDSTQAAGSVSVSAIGTPLGGGGAEILLSDGSTITLKGVDPNSLLASTTGSGVVIIH
jgi:hypothetical protein